MTDESVFAAALAIPSPADRAAYLDRACAGNPVLRAEVDALLAAHAASNPLDRPPADLGATGGYDGGDGPPAAAVGDRVGPYRLMEQIGEGGMGLVFVAEQTEPVRRKVALKVIKPGMDTRQVVARFEAERQALALMDHPHIARVLDAGATPEGRPYFVMELVRGLPITDYCDQQKLPPRDRLALFVQVCQAVQHAHQKGVIHRDIKPSNVLVAPHDGVPVVKVIDFGVAKAVGQSLTDKTIYTRFAQMIGTPLYMSPEQAEVNQLDVDTRADVYALGVLLYELLTGTTPFDGDRFRKAAFDEIRRILREEDPPKPSTRLTSLGATLTGVSARRGTDPARLAGLVRGELDWIVMKCLEKDRNRRYDSAAGLAKDVQRHLAGELVEARPPTLGYRVRKYVHRNRTVITVALLFAVTLKVTTLVSIWQASRAFVAEAFAEQQRDEAEAARNAEADRRAEAERLAAELKRAAYATDINLAAASLELGNVGRARELLDRTRPAAGEPARGFEWHYLRRELQQETATFPGGYGNARVAISPDGRYLAATFAAVTKEGQKGRVRVWEAATGRETWTGKIDGAFAGLIAFSPDGSRVGATRWSPGRRDAGLEPPRAEFRVWDVKTGAELGQTTVDETDWSAIAFSPDGSTVAGLLRASEANPSTVIATYATDRLAERSRTTVPGGARGSEALTYTRAGRLRVAYQDDAETVRVRDDLGGPDVLAFDSRSEGHAQAVSLSADGTKLAVATADRQVRVWDLAADPPALRGRFRVEHYTSSSRLGLGPDGRSLAVAATYTTGRSLVTVWDVGTGKLVRTLRGHTAAVEDVAVGADGRTLATTSEDWTVKLWDVPPWAEPDQAYHANASFARAGLAVRPDGTFASLAYHVFDNPRADDRWRTFELRAEPGGRPVFTTPRVPLVIGNMRGAAVAPDGRRLAAIDWNAPDGVQVWDTGTGKALATLPADGVPGKMAWLGPADRLLVLEPDAAYRLYDLATGRSLARFAGGHNRFDLCAFSPDGRLLVTHTPGRAKSPVVVRDAATGAELRTLADFKGLAGVIVFSRDSARLATSAPGGEMTLWDVATGRAVRRLTGHAGRVQAADFSPDGGRLFTGGADSTVKVWDTATGQDLLTLRHDDAVEAVAVSPDGHRLATQVGRGAVVRVFDATPLPEPKP